MGSGLKGGHAVAKSSHTGRAVWQPTAKTPLGHELTVTEVGFGGACRRPETAGPHMNWSADAREEDFARRERGRPRRRIRLSTWSSGARCSWRGQASAFVEPLEVQRSRFASGLRCRWSPDRYGSSCLTCRNEARNRQATVGHYRRSPASALRRSIGHNARPFAIRAIG